MAHALTTPAAEHLIESPKQPLDQAPPTTTAVHNLSFPPFPHLKNNTPLIPFAEFVPKGTQIKRDDDEDGVATAVELDGEGIPTVMLGVTHDLDKSHKKRKSKASSGGLTRGPKPWFEQWADNEVLMRAERLDPAQFTPHEILLQADIDFQQGRFFPLSVRALYDEFRVFIGIVERIEKRQPFRRYKKQQRDTPPGATQQQHSTVDDEADEEYLSDDLDIDDDEIGIPTSKIRSSDGATIPSFSLPQVPPATTGEYEGEEDYSGSLEPLMEHSQLDIQVRCEQFIANPAQAVKCFLSHEYRNRGLYWLEFNLHAGPIIVSSFLEFIIRHELLPMAEYGKTLKEAAEVARGARDELPKTKKASAVLRDGWGTVCVGIWGLREEAQWGIDGFSWTSAKADDEGYITELSDAPVATLIDETDESLLSPISGGNPAVETEALPNTNLVPAVPNKLSNDSLKTTATVVVDPATLATATGADWGWGSNSTSSTNVPTEDSVSTPLAAPVPAAHGWGTNEDDEIGSRAGSPTWEAISPAPTMFTYVGCASFPLTHAPVRAECSVREIIAIRPPMDIFASTHANPIHLLHSKLATIVLGPWRSANNERSYKEGGDVPPPVMLRMCSSEREEKRTEKDDQAEEEFPAQFFRIGEVGRTHDAFKDVITVFVDPKIIDNLAVGLGVGGTFVQVARRLDAPTFPAIKDGNAAHHYNDASTKALPPYKPNDGRSWWYIDNVTQVIPSYWTDLGDLPVV